MAFRTGQASSIVLILLFSFVVLYKIRTTHKGDLPELRHLPALDALGEAIGRATETGKPVHFAPGQGSLTSDQAPQTFAATAILAEVARRTATQHTNLIVTIMSADILPLVRGVVRQAYTEAGSPEDYREDMIRFISTDQYAYAAGATGIIYREQAAANIMVGHFMAESLLLAEAGATIGAIQVSGTTTTHQIAFFVVACDYTLLGDELFAAAAMLSKDPVGVGSIVGQDIGKAIALAIMALGAILATMGVPILNQILSR